MTAANEEGAWLEAASGERFPLDGTTSLGRSQTLNRYGFPADKVSRRHALIHAQEGGEFWLVDLGSTNGTYIGGERVAAPTRLRNGDRVDLGRCVELVFREPISAAERRGRSMDERTKADTREELRWLLVADIAESTTLSKTLPPAQLALVVGEWLAACTELVNAHGGRINQYTGDGFLAFWRDSAEAAPAVARALLALRQLRDRAHLVFRVVLHRGVVAVGGVPSMGEESMLSDDLSLTFRLEKLAASLGLPFLLSAAAAEPLRTQVSLQAVPGRHELKGYPAVENLATLA